jgi:hypothetical protein
MTIWKKDYPELSEEEKQKRLRALGLALKRMRKRRMAELAATEAAAKEKPSTADS